jgi:hypothetical protein
MALQLSFRGSKNKTPTEAKSCGAELFIEGMFIVAHTGRNFKHFQRSVKGLIIFGQAFDIKFE